MSTIRPAAKMAEEDLMNEAYVEHDGAKVLVAEIEAGNPDDQYYDAKVKVLSEMIKHHVKEEEKKQGNMFAKSKKAGVDTKALGQQMAAEKKTLTAQYKSEGLAQTFDAHLHRHQARLSRDGAA